MSDLPAYCKIGTTNISPYVRTGGITKIGGGAKYSSASIPGTRRYSMYHDGVDPRGWALELRAVHDTEEATLDGIMALFNGATENTKFYPFSASKFARILMADASEASDNVHKLSSIWKAEANVYATINDLFAEASTVWTPSASEFKSITPAGSIAAPLDELEIIGVYDLAHITGPTLEIWNAAKTILEDSVRITDMLLTDENLILDYQGEITQVYSDLFTNASKFAHDATNAGCSVSSEGLTIGHDCSATWKLSGPWPLTKNIVITGVVTGSGYLLYSYDNLVWKIAASNTTLAATTSWTVPGTAGHSDVYIRFASSSGGIDAVGRTEDTILAEILAASRNRDNYYKGIWGRTFQAGEYMYVVKLATTTYAYQLQKTGAPVLTLPWKVGTDYDASLDLYNNSVAVTIPDRTTIQILADITTPIPAKDTTTYYKGVWGRINGSSTYAFVVKLDSGEYEYQIQQSGTPVLTNTWYIGTDAELSAALYAASVIVGDRSEATILADITTPNVDRTPYYRGIWGRTANAGYYMFIIKLAADLYAYQGQIEGAAVLTNPWSIGTADKAASDLYNASAPVPVRTSVMMQADINTGVAARKASDYYRGVWGRTFGSGYYMLMFKLKSDLYAYQIQSSGVNTSNPFYVGTGAQASAALYAASQVGPRNATSIATDITNTSFPSPTGAESFIVWGKVANVVPYCTIIVLQNSPLVLAYKGTDLNGDSPTWYLDTAGGATIVNDLVNNSVDPGNGTRSLANIRDDIINNVPDSVAYSWSVGGPFTAQKPSATVLQINTIPQAFAYQIMLTTGVLSTWAIDANAGHGTVAALMQATPGSRSVDDIKASLLASGFTDPVTYSYQAYGYVNGARPVATVIQVQNSPQKLVYKLSKADNTITAWAVEANAGLDCRDALIADFTGVIGGRTQADIRSDITGATWTDPTTIDWQVYGLTPGIKPLANIIQVQNTPRVFGYQIDSLSGGPGAWAIDSSLGASIAAMLVSLSSGSTTVSGTMRLHSMIITQKRRIPWQELPVIPLDGLAHNVRISGAQYDESAVLTSGYLKATGLTFGDNETFTVSAASAGKSYLLANNGRYLSSGWGQNYVTCIAETAGQNEEFEIILLGPSRCAIRCISGQYLSVKDSGLGFVMATSPNVGAHEIFEQEYLGGGQWAYRVYSPVAEDPLILDAGILDQDVLDGAVDEASIYAGKYLSAVSGTLTGVDPITITYRDRFYI